MEENCKIEILSFYEREEKVYQALTLFLEGEYAAVPGGDYIDLASKKVWIVTGLLISMSHSNKKRMTVLESKDGTEVPYEGMVLEKME